MFLLISQPWVRVARSVCAGVVPYRYVPLVAVFLLLLVLLCATTIAKVRICLCLGAALCKLGLRYAAV